MYSYTFIFKIFGFIQVFLLVSKKKIYIYIYKSHSSFWNRFYLMAVYITRDYIVRQTFIVIHHDE